jgi:predicted TIM-barrel fold metal-dependent hydrolase
MISPEKALAGLDALDLDEEVRDLVLGANACRLFGLS